MSRDKKQHRKRGLRTTVVGTHVRLPGGVDVKLTSPPPAPFNESGHVRAGVEVTRETATTFLEWLYRQDAQYVAYILVTIADHVAAMARIERDGRSADVIPGSPAALVAGRLLAGAARGDLDMCVHVRQRAPDTAVWQAYRPGKLRCWDCAHAVDLEIRGTPEDRRCDHCGHVGSVVFSAGAVVGPRSYRGVIVPAVALYGLCRLCHGASAPPGSVADPV